MKHESMYPQSPAGDACRVSDNLPERCAAACLSLVRQVQNLKESLFTEFRQSLRGGEQVLRAALNEAEALAWQTPYPHLFFPVLAQEKAVAARRWAVRQQRVRETTRDLRRAA